MNLKKIILSVFISSTFWGYAQAQSVDDAVTFSKDDNPASARIKGMGNVQTSLGGDISAINGNPAGLGFFSRSDISITFDYLQNNNKADFLGTSSTSKKGNFRVSQAGIVFNFPNRNQIAGYAGWQNFNMGISYNKKQNFNNTIMYNGINKETSYVNNLIDLMYQPEGDDFKSSFINSNLIEQFKNKNEGYFPLTSEFDDKEQFNDLFSKGSHSNTAIAFGGNYNNKFYIGGTLGLSFFKYEKNKIFNEFGWTKTAEQVKEDNPDSEYAKPANPKSQYLDKNYELIDDYLQTNEGSGVDFKLGMIYKPTTDWNVGLTITTPTWLSINDKTDVFTETYLYEDEVVKDHFYKYRYSIVSDQDYNITTPWKFALGATKFFNRGLLSAEMEYITYNTIRYSNPSRFGSYQDINNTINDELQGAINLRIGGEYLINNIISGRTGFNYIGNPYQYAEESNISGSLGLGFKLTNSLYADVALVHQVNSYSVSPYSLSSFWHDSGSFEPIADLKLRRTNAMLTIGAKF